MNSGTCQTISCEYIKEKKLAPYVQILESLQIETCHTTAHNQQCTTSWLSLPMAATAPSATRLARQTSQTSRLATQTNSWPDRRHRCRPSIEFCAHAASNISAEHC